MFPVPVILKQANKPQTSVMPLLSMNAQTDLKRSSHSVLSSAVLLLIGPQCRLIFRDANAAYSTAKAGQFLVRFWKSLPSPVPQFFYESAPQVTSASKISRKSVEPLY